MIVFSHIVIIKNHGSFKVKKPLRDCGMSWLLRLHLCLFLRLTNEQILLQSHFRLQSVSTIMVYAEENAYCKFVCKVCVGDVL